MRLVLLALAAFFVLPACAADYRSKFGYAFQLSDDWVVLTYGELIKLAGEATPQSLGLTGVEPTELKQTPAKVKSGQVEFYFDRKHSTQAWNNNISVQLAPARSASIAELAKTCPSLGAQLRGTYGPSTRMAECGRRVQSGVEYLAYEYVIATEGVTIVQYEIPYAAQGTLVIVGGSNAQGLKDLKAAQEHLAAMAIKNLKPGKP